MKKSILTLGVILFSMVVFAQKSEQLMGPEYKNRKPGELGREASVAYSVQSETKLMGPEYKNKKPGQQADNRYTTLKVGTERSKLKGPAYKNYRH